MAHTMKLTDILGFEKELERLERSRATVEKYARDVRAFYRWLPEGKTFEKETVIRSKLLLCERYAPASPLCTPWVGTPLEKRLRILRMNLRP